MLIDLHVHSEFSFDSDEKIVNYISAAKMAGFPIVGFSEHHDYDAVLDGEDIAVVDIPDYIKAVNEIKNAAKTPQILCGIEFGYRDAAVEKYRDLIKTYDFDYVINSVHTLKGRGDCFHDRFFEGRPLKESYSEYFKAVLESVKADFDYQIVGHLGYVSRYREGDGAQIFYDDYADIIDKILTEIIRRDKCLEINSSTGKSGSQFLPDCDIIKRYLQLGGKKLSFGSDAHSVNNYMKKSGEVCEFLKSIGVIELYYYKKHKPIAYKI